MLKINNLNAKIQEKSILSGFNLEIKPGEVHAIMGPNGSGKSTLSNILSGKKGYEVSGEILYENKNLFDLETEERAHEGIFLAFQYPLEIPGVNNNNFLKTSVNAIRKAKGQKEYDALEFLKLVKQKAKEVVDFLNLGHLSNELAGNLSGGQKKLLELGRTMMVDAKLVLLDEVGAGVNRTLLKDLGSAIEKLNKEKGYTFCMIEHDMDFIGRLCDPVIVMAEGSVLFEGSVEDAKKDERVIESYLGRGSKIKDHN